MLTLTINPETAPDSRTFDKSSIIIGAESVPTVDIALPGENLQSIHVKIILEEERWIVFNAANDPFVTLNSLPFSKKKLNQGDLIQIGKTVIRFDGPKHKIVVQQPPVPLQKAEAAVERTITTIKKNPIPQIKPPELSYPEVQDESLWEQVEELAKDTEETHRATPVAKKMESISLPKPIPKVEVKPLALPTKSQEHELLFGVHLGSNFESKVYDLDEDPPVASREKAKPTEEIQGHLLNWNLFFLGFIAMLLISTLIAGGVYVSMAEKREMEKVTAAEGVADVAMALMYAQVNHIKPQKQNWSDTEFLKNNLSSILSPEYPSFGNLDNLGQFINCPYICRIYTSSDLSQFLVIAQPEPSLLQWLLPKNAIVVDSREMELRTLSDLRALNRLLLSPTTLDGSNATEISNLVKQGTLIPLHYISTKQRNPEFAPPKALALIRPGAENRIYNAPRYFPFGESALRTAAALLESTGNSYEVTRLKQELSELSHFPNFILYSSQGMQKAIHAQKALSILMPQHQFLAAYLNFNKEGILTSSHLLIDEQQQSDPVQSEKEIALAFKNELTAHPHFNAVPDIKIEGSVDHNHPLYLQLFILAVTRQHALKPIVEKINILLQEDTEKGVGPFSTQLATLTEEYRTINDEQHEKIREGLSKLYQEYSNLSLDDFSNYVKAAGLDLFAKENLAKKSEDPTGKVITEQQIAFQMQKIKESNNFATLEKNVQEAVEMLTLANFPDPDLLIRYQNEMRVLALQQVRRHILSPDHSLPAALFTDENKATLNRILQAAWVNDKEEYEYYLHEFELRGV